MHFESRLPIHTERKRKRERKEKKRIVRNDGWRENGGKTAFERWSECSIKRSSTEDKKVKEGWKGRGYRDRREGHDKERKAREKARSRRYSSWTRDTSLYPHSATSWLKQLLLQLSLANPAFRAVSRTPLGDFGDEPSNHVFRSLFSDRFWISSSSIFRDSRVTFLVEHQTQNNR